MNHDKEDNAKRKKVWKFFVLVLKNVLKGHFCKTFTAVTTISGLYYKPMTIVNDDSRVVNKLEATLIDNARVAIYDRHMFIVQATVVS